MNIPLPAMNEGSAFGGAVFILPRLLWLAQ
jgi:hypothetical protein